MPPNDAPKRRGRPPVWQTRIKAPPLALELYRLMARLQNSDAFRTCHVYEGSHDHAGIPMFKFGGKVTAMPYVISTFMGVEYGTKTCQTPGCTNPFHYAPPTDRINPALMEFVAPTPAVDEGWTDLIDYYVEDKGIALEFKPLREAIPLEDIGDDALRGAIEMYKERGPE